jgi:hypothetical protein
VASGKGFYGRMAKAFVGAKDFGRIQGALNTGIDVQAMVGMGVPTMPATVVSIADSGQLVNNDPIVDLVVQFADEHRTALRTIVSKLRMPRVGEAVQLIADPRQPGGLPVRGRPGRLSGETVPRAHQIASAHSGWSMNGLRLCWYCS